MDGSDPRTLRVLAWSASVGLHAVAALAVLRLPPARALEARGDEPVREVGVVLRVASQPPSPFDAAAVSEADADAADAESAVAPTPVRADAVAAGPFAELLGELLERAEPGSGPRVGAPGASAAAPAAVGGGRPALPIGKARVPFLGVEGVGSRFVYVLDRSMSMDGGPLRAVKAHLLASLEAIGPTQQFHILFFNTRVTALDLTGGQRRIAFGVEASKRHAADLVMAVNADGGTERKGALDEALRYRPDVVFFLTDDDTPMTPGQLGEIIEDAAGSVSIHTIEFGKGPDHGRRNFLVELAERTGGQHAYIDSSRLPRQ